MPRRSGAELRCRAAVQSCAAELRCRAALRCRAVVPSCAAELWCRAVVQSCGAELQSCGAELRLLLHRSVARRARPVPEHHQAAGLRVASYPYYDPSSCSLDFDAMIAALEALAVAMAFLLLVLPNSLSE